MTQFEKSSQILSVIALLLGGAVICGWFFNIPLLIQVYKTFVPMQFNTALCLILLALSILTIGRYYHLSDALALAAFFIAGITLLQYFLSISLGIDEFFLKHYITTFSAHPGRMSPNTALCYLLMGTGVVLFHRYSYQPANHFISLLTVLLVFAIALLSIIGYLLDMPQAYGFEGLTGMAIHTAVGFILLSIALLRVNQGILVELRTSGKWVISVVIFFSSIVFFLLLLQALSLYYYRLEESRKQEVIQQAQSVFSDKIKTNLRLLAGYFERSTQATHLIKKEGNFYLGRMSGLEILMLPDKKTLVSPELSSLNQSIEYLRCEDGLKKSAKPIGEWKLALAEGVLCASYHQKAMVIFDVNKLLDAVCKQIGVKDTAFRVINSNDKSNLSDVWQLNVNGLNIAIHVESSQLRISQVPNLIYTLFFLLSLLFSIAVALCYWMFGYIFASRRLDHSDLATIQKHESVWEDLGIAMMLIDNKGHIGYCNDVLLRVSNYHFNELKNQPIQKLLPKIDSLKPVLNHGEKLITKDKKEKRVNISLSFSDEKQLKALVGFVDIGHLHHREEMLANKNKQMQLVQDIMINTSDSEDINDFILLCLNRLCGDLGWSTGHFQLVREDEFEALVKSHIWYADTFEGAEKFIQTTEKIPIKKGGDLAGRAWMSKQAIWMGDVSKDSSNVRNFHCCGSEYLSAVAFPVVLKQRVIGVIELFSKQRRDEDTSMMMTLELIGEQVARIFDKQQTKRQLLDLKYYDSVTGLPNRDYFMTMLDTAILEADKDDDFFALIYIDLDNFKKINDIYSHEVGDELLKMVAGKLVQVFSEDSLARVGGDEFALIVRNLRAPIQAGQVARKILDIFTKPLSFHHDSVQVRLSIGLVVYPYSAKAKADLLSSVEIALHRAKELGKDQYQFFSEDLNIIHRRRLALEEGLKSAIDKCELEVYYQPQFSFDNYKVSGFEALLRWHSKILGEVSPYEFIPVAEEMGLINEIGLWVMQESIRQFTQWRDYFHENDICPVLSINVSGIQLTQSPLVDQVRNLLKRYHFNPHHLVLEITETALMDNIETSRKLLSELSELGIGLAIDDFGTGYSSLSLLQKLPFTELKIDKSFVDKITESEDAREIVKAILQLARVMRLGVVAEGVEEEEQLNFFCSALEQVEKSNHFVQGYYFSKPLSSDAVEKFLEKIKKPGA